MCSHDTLPSYLVGGVWLLYGTNVSFERNDRQVVLLAKRLLALRGKVVVPAGVVGQVWRNGSRQVRLSRLLGSPLAVVEPLDDRRARAAGQICGVSGTRDFTDAAVVLAARESGLPVATSDLADLRRLDAKVRLVVV